MLLDPSPPQYHHRIKTLSLDAALTLALPAFILLTILQVCGTSISTFPATQHYGLARAIRDAYSILDITFPYYELEPHSYGIP